MLDEYRDKREHDQAALEGMVFYAQTGLCRWQVLLSHLEGHEARERCTTCDNCRRIALHEAQLRESMDARSAPIEATQPRFAPAATVSVKRYGIGQVVAADALAVDIEFADGSRRSFHPDFVQPTRARGTLRSLALAP